MVFPLRNRRRNSLIAAALLGGLVALWSVGWFAVAWQFQARIEDWITARRAEGWTVSHGHIAVTGFPYRWRARIDSPHLVQGSPQGTGFAWSGPWILVRWVPWSPTVVGLRARGTHHLAWGGPPFTVNAGDLRSFLRFGARGGIVEAGFDSDDVTVTTPDGDAFRIDQTSVRATTTPRLQAPPAGPPPAGGATVKIFGLTMPQRVAPPLGRTIGRIAADATLMGAIPRGAPAVALTAWRDGGGTVELSKLTLAWGALGIEASGTLALDSGLQPIGAMTAHISGYDETVDRLTATGILKPAQGLMAKLALGALARTPANGGPPQLTVPVSAQDGMLQVGPVALLRLPKIVWQ